MAKEVGNLAIDIAVDFRKMDEDIANEVEKGK